MNIENILKKTFATASILTVLGLSTAFSQGNVRNANDVLITGYGTDLVRTEATAPIEGVVATWDPVSVPGDEPPDPYTFQTASDGTYDYEVQVFWELYVNVNNNIQKQVVEVRPTLSADFTFNFLTQQKNEELNVYDLNGKVIDVQRPTDYVNNISSYYTNLTGKPNGVYFYSLKTPEKMYSGKLMKVGNKIVGNLGILQKEAGLKNTNSTYEATYEVTYIKEGYDTLVDTVTVHEDQNPIMVHTMTENGGEETPQYQYIGGYTWNEDLNGLQGVIIEMYKRSNDELLDTATSNSSGKYQFDNSVPAGIDVYFKVEKNNDYYAYDGSISLQNKDTYEVPDVIEDNNDTITDDLQFVMYDKLREIGNTGNYIIVSADHIRDMIGNTDLNIEVALRNLKYYLGTSMSQSQKQGFRNNADNFENIIDYQNLFEESSTPLNQGTDYDPYNPTFSVGVNVEQGTNNTNWDNINVTTPLGNYLSPVFKSDMTLVDANYLAFLHEIGRAMGDEEVSWFGVMRGDSPGFTDGDKVMFKLGIIHSKMIYDLGKSYFGLSSITESLDKSNTRAPYKEK